MAGRSSTGCSTFLPDRDRRSGLRLSSITVGAFAENTYVIAPEHGTECAVVDPGAEAGRIVDAVRGAGLTVRYILTTHGHADHTGAASKVKRELGGTYAVHQADADLVANPDPWIVGQLGDFESPPEVDLKVLGGESLPIGDLNVEVMATPGHTPGSVCYRCEFVVFTGDTLFKGSIGRYDLPGGDGAQELDSIRRRLLSLPGETVVLPGHGPRTSIESEMRSNPFLRFGS